MRPAIDKSDLTFYQGRQLMTVEFLFAVFVYSALKTLDVTIVNSFFVTFFECSTKILPKTDFFPPKGY